MGLLYLGTALTWEESKKYIDHVRNHGITQFLHTWDRLKDRQGDVLLWGDEIECMVISLDKKEKSAKLSLRQTEILQKLGSVVNGISVECADEITAPTFHPEYGSYMIESTPGSPYTGVITDLLSVERNMRYRRALVRSHLKPTELLVTLTSFPRLGTLGVFTEPYFDPKGAASSRSLFLPDELMSPHVRYPTLTANIRARRGSKVAINVPIFVDTNVPRPFIDPTIPWDRDIYPEDSEAKNGAALPDHIYLDAMGFGAGCCCLQLTLQACNVDEARRVYDALIPIGPILLALTAASPIWRGYLTDVDCRWNVIAGSLDDRTDEERGLKPLRNDKRRVPKFRYDSVDMYLSNDWINRPEYNDIDSPIDEDIYKRLRDAGLDDLLSKHVSHLFIRDPLVTFWETIDQDDAANTDHFENIQSTNWQTLRFKPPPPNSPIGWRVEFRSMEVQMTDFENAAFSVFLVLLTRAVLAFNLNFYMPISKVDENMQRAQVRDASRTGKFFFRKDVLPPGQTSPTSSQSGESTPDDFSDCGSIRRKETKMRNCFPALPRPAAGVTRGPVEEEYAEMTMEEIMTGNGKLCGVQVQGGGFPGLLGLVNAYVDTLDMTEEKRAKIDKYLSLVKRRSDGSLKTQATWMRDFVRSHPAYKFDSVVNQEINYDLMVAVDEVERGVRREPTLLPGDYNGGANDAGSIKLAAKLPVKAKAKAKANHWLDAYVGKFLPTLLFAKCCCDWSRVSGVPPF
ncbi:glutamate-cysteine ligase catalytic subunit [Athelia psychrophila]|uniref:Glutamate--cysteine ligase n=1 Tax=Athelia psychrophila TaxID=1759441 RepID=A0A167WCM2_9AGAM|nr:glutamate-cysteine ligase catalytic subunit [Fibularhizoctonia sp. CBS 109695]